MHRVKMLQNQRGREEKRREEQKRREEKRREENTNHFLSENPTWI